MQLYVFACIHNAGRSQMASAFFNLLADPNLARSLSAGTAPINHVHPEVIRFMREEGIDLAKSRPQKLTHELVNQAIALVTIGCGEDWPPVPGLERLDWPVPDPGARTSLLFEPFATRSSPVSSNFCKKKASAEKGTCPGVPN